MNGWGWLLVLVALLFSVGPLLFLGGLTSAWLEIRRERRAGRVPTRPAWENRDKRRALGGFRGVWRSSWQKARRGKMATCWCGEGPLVEFPECGGFPAGLGCAAWESGLPRAIYLHDAAGGYKRVPVAPSPRSELSAS